MRIKGILFILLFASTSCFPNRSKSSVEFIKNELKCAPDERILITAFVLLKMMSGKKLEIHTMNRREQREVIRVATAYSRYMSTEED